MFWQVIIYLFISEILAGEITNLISNDEVKTIHIPFKKEVLLKAIDEFSISNMPSYTVTVYKENAYDELL